MYIFSKLNKITFIVPKIYIIIIKQHKRLDAQSKKIKALAGWQTVTSCSIDQNL